MHDPAAEHLIAEGNALEDAGRYSEALQRYDAALELAPKSPRAHLNRGNALLATNKVEGAIAAYEQALALDPRLAPAHYNLGNALARDKRYQLAANAYREAIVLKPDFAMAFAAMGAAHEELGQPEEALASYRQALTIDPGLAGVDFRMGLVLQQLGSFDEALASYERAVKVDPRPVEAHSNAGIINLRLGRVTEAIACHRQALAIDSEFAEGHFNLANALRDGGWPLDSIESYRRAIAIKPGFAHAHVGLGDLLKDRGRLDEAAVSFRRALEIDPHFQEAHTSLLFCLDHDEAIDPDRLFAEHRRFGESFEAPLRGHWPAHPNGRDSERRLRVGIVSGDLCAHPVGYFLEPLLGPLSRQEGLSLHAYSNNVLGDEVTGRMRPYFRSWDVVAALSDDALARKVTDDAIDILIDLSGHTSKNRLQTFARKPAPIEISWLAYPGTTGLTALDYYLADEEFLPFKEFGGQFTEKLVHLPAVVPFLAPAGAPPVSPLPAAANGYVTFGSFTRPSKLRPPVIALWARLLHALPGARLLLGAMPQEGQYEEIKVAFARESIPRERLEFHSRCDMTRYLQLHHRVDVCLDTFPYTGGTTTAHALLMGVPTLILAGRTPAGRLGTALLRHAALDEFVVMDARDYVGTGVRLSSNLDALAAIRAGMRGRCESVSETKPEAIAASLELAFRTMWRRWCAGLPPEAFAVKRTAC